MKDCSGSGEWLVIRADGSPGMGTGHLMRCLALAQEWKDRGGNIVLVTACKVPALLEWFAREGVHIVQLQYAHPDSGDLDAMRRVLNEYPRARAVIDGYHFDVQYQSSVAEDHCVLVIDDNGHLPEYRADIILNQNMHATTVARRYPSSSTLLLGPSYALLRREFRNRDAHPDTQPETAQRILVLMGGSDPSNVSREVLGALDKVTVPGLQVAVLVGAANQHQAELDPLLRSLACDVTVKRDAHDVVPWMMRSHLAVAGAGTVTWELCCIGVPTILISVADNQRLSARTVAAAGLAIWAGDAEDIVCDRLAQIINELMHDRTRRIELAARCRRAVDGRGAQRVVDVLWKAG